MSLSQVLARIDSSLDDSLTRLFELLRIPSISADQAYRGACREAATWCAVTLTGIGFDSSVRDTIGHPMVVGHWTGAGPGAPHVLFYGHYDVQPVDPLSLWESDPFDPIIVNASSERQIVARGASDDKGQLMTFVEAARAWVAETGGLPINV